MKYSILINLRNLVVYVDVVEEGVIGVFVMVIFWVLEVFEGLVIWGFLRVFDFICLM